MAYQVVMDWLSAHAGIGFAAFLASAFFLMAGLGFFARTKR